MPGKVGVTGIAESSSYWQNLYPQRVRRPGKHIRDGEAVPIHLLIQTI
jgi:hypothetical protein